MLIGMLMALLIVGLLYAGPTFENTLVAIAVYGGIIVGMIVAWWYSGQLSGGIAGMMMGGSGGKAKQTYSLGDRYEAEQKYDAAIDYYRQAIDEDKKNPAPRLKLADLYYRLRDYDNCIKYMLEALAIPKGMSEAERCTRMNRIADMYLQRKHDPARAIAVLKRIVQEYPKSKYAGFARERIHNIRKGG